MSNIIILTLPVAGHFNPFVPIANTLIERGHSICWITGRHFKTKVENTGATFHPLPEQWDPGDKDPYEFLPELKEHTGLSQVRYYLKHVLFDPVLDILSELGNVLRIFQAEVVIEDTFMPAGIWITELGGPPNIRLSVLPLSMPGEGIAPYGTGYLPAITFLSKIRNKSLNVIVDALVYKDVLNYANQYRKEVGLPAYQKHLSVEHFERPALTMHTSTPAFEYYRKEYPPSFRFIGPIVLHPDEEYVKPNWWQEMERDKPVILVNQGTVAGDIDMLIHPAIEGLEDENAIVLAVSVKKGEILDLPKNTYVESFIPFGNLLPHIDIMVTNGGFGGTQNALAHGIPLVIAGATEDKMEVAARVEYCGAGINLRKLKPTPQEVRQAVVEVQSDPSYRTAARRVQADFAKYDAPTMAIEFIEELLRKHGTLDPA